MRLVQFGRSAKTADDVTWSVDVQKGHYSAQSIVDTYSPNFKMLHTWKVGRRRFKSTM